MHAKYEVSISNGSKVIANVKVDNRQTNRQTDRQTNKQTGQKQYAPDHSIRGHKKLKVITLLASLNSFLLESELNIYLINCMHINFT